MKSGIKGYDSIWYISKIPITSRPAPRKRELLSMFLVVYACHVITKIEKDRTKGKSSVEISGRVSRSLNRYSEHQQFLQFPDMIC
jgi:hypothetical protein